MSWDILPKGNLQYFLQKLKAKFDLKVDKEAGKGLSANDYTTTEKNKLAGIEAGAQVNPTIDSALSDSSTNAVQNKVVKAALDGKAGREEIPTKVSQLTNDSGYTTNTGTVTQVKVGSAAYNPSSGVVSLPSYPAAVAVKGNAESTYRTGNVNITPANIGLGNVNNTKDSSKNVNSANKVNYTKSTSEGTLTYPCEVEGALSNSEDKIPNSAAVVSYLNSNYFNISNRAVSSNVISKNVTGGTLDMAIAQRIGKLVIASARIYNLSIAASQNFFKLAEGYRPTTTVYGFGYMIISDIAGTQSTFCTVNQDGTVSLTWSASKTCTQVGFYAVFYTS